MEIVRVTTKKNVFKEFHGGLVSVNSDAPGFVIIDEHVPMYADSLGNFLSSDHTSTDAAIIKSLQGLLEWVTGSWDQPIARVLTNDACEGLTYAMYYEDRCIGLFVDHDLALCIERAISKMLDPHRDEFSSTFALQRIILRKFCDELKMFNEFDSGRSRSLSGAAFYMNDKVICVAI